MKTYTYQSTIYAVPGKGGAYTIFPYNIRKNSIKDVLKSMLHLMAMIMMGQLLTWNKG
ncbi:hypothetical protein ADO07_00991 [Streptococcus parauberis]|nr:hypothetical protein ADO07_00991 [Streptococcus parauberis]